jgi:hypothetical protein
MPDYHAPSLRCFSETDLGVRSDRRDELGRAGVRPECSRHQGTNVCRVLRKLRPNIERYDSDRLVHPFVMAGHFVPAIHVFRAARQ